MNSLVHKAGLNGIRFFALLVPPLWQTDILSPLKSGKMYLIDERMCGFVSEAELDEQKGEEFHVAQVGLNLICSQG